MLALIIQILHWIISLFLAWCAGWYYAKSKELNETNEALRQIIQDYTNRSKN